MQQNAQECVWEKTPPLSGKNPTKPVKLHQSRASKALELIQAQRQALKLESGLRKLARQLAEEESKIQRELRACAADSQPASLLQARLTPIQKRLGSLHAHCPLL